MKKSFLIIIVVIIALFPGCGKKAINIKPKRIKFEKSVTTKEVLNDEYLSLLFSDCLDKKEQREYDLYSFYLTINNDTENHVLSFSKTDIVDAGGKSYLKTNGRDLKSNGVVFSPEIKYLGISDRYSIPAHESNRLIFQMLIEKEHNNKFEAVFSCLTGNKTMKYTEIPVNFYLR